MSNLAVAESTEVVSAGEEEQLVTMMVDDQLFGIPILRVQDIVEPQQITPVPRAPSAIAGVLNLRGRIVTVIDLRECLGAPPVPEDGRLMSVTVEHKGDLFTLLVDSIGDVRSLPRNAFDKPPVTLDQRMRRLCSGVFRLEGQLLAVLEVEKVLDEEFIASMPVRTRPRLNLERAKKERGREKKEAAAAGPVKKAPANDEADKPAAKKDAGASKVEVSLYERLGGEAAIDSAVDLFYEKAAADERLAPFFDGFEMSVQGAAVKAYLAQALGGPKTDKGGDIRSAQQQLVHEKGLDDSHFIAGAGHFADTLNQMSVPDDLIHEVLAAVEGLRDEVLGR